MSYDIDAEIITSARLCQTGCSCLKGEQGSLCKITECIGSSIHFIYCEMSKSCDYRMSFGDAHVCNCPVRKEIFNKYKA